MKKAQLFSVFSAFLLIVFGFQNCSAPLPEEGSESGASVENSKVNFAYNTVVDQVAYMSCHQLGNTFDRSSYFTFRVGAYTPASGVGLNPNFLFDLSKFPASERKTLLTEEPINAGAFPLLSVRDLLQLQGMYVSNRSSAVAGSDYAPMLTTLNNEALAKRFLKAIETDPRSFRIQYQRGGSPEGYRVEGDLNLNNGVSGLNDLQTFLNNDGVLAITYPVSTRNMSSIRAPGMYFSDVPTSSINSQVYGTGLKVTFRRPSGTSTGPFWALGSVEPRALEQTTSQQTLSCPNELVFKIADRRHLTGDAANVDSTKIYCEQKPDNPSALSAADRELLRRARLSLRAEDWFIDWNRKCIIPKKFDGSVSQCYGSATIPIEYDVTKTCYENPSASSGLKACAAFASICIK